MKFNYQARTRSGEISTGNIEASSKPSAIELLQKNGLYVTFLEVAQTPIYAKSIKIFEGVSQKDLVLFSRQLSIMFKSKVPLVESLKVLVSQIKNSDLREKIIKISDEVEAGTSFSKALSLYPRTFSPFYIAMVKSGEVSGKLSEVLNYLAEHLEREYHLMSKTKGAMVYPALIFVVVFSVIALMVYFVIPNLAGVIEGSGEDVPGVTSVVIGSAFFLKKWGWMIMICLVALLFGSFYYYRSSKGKVFFDSFLLKVPFIGSIMKMVYLSRFAENLSTLIAGGLPITQALETVGDIIDNVSYKKVILKAKKEVERGETISSVLNQNTDIFPPVFVQMIMVGERTGTLDTSLLNIAEFYQKEADRSIESTLGIMEPLLIVFLGLVVAGIMLSILMPLYKIISI